MQTIKNTLLASFAVLAGATSLLAVAAPIDHTIMLQATVPTATFYVQPSDASWIGTRQVLAFNPLTGELGSLSKSFDVLHTAGSIKAQLTSLPTMAGSDGNSIALTVKFNGKTLTSSFQDVVLKPQAANPSAANLEVIPTKPTTGYVPGNYSGNIALTFDATIVP